MFDIGPVVTDVYITAMHKKSDELGNVEDSGGHDNNDQNQEETVDFGSKTVDTLHNYSQGKH